jgi:hypothetical protein
MKAIITGGRAYHLTAADYVWLARTVETLGITEILTGAAPGTDTDALTWAKAMALKATPFPVSFRDWQRFGKAAGPLRNRQMLDSLMLHHPAVVIAFPGGKGTADCVRQATARGVRVIQRNVQAQETPHA